MVSGDFSRSTGPRQSLHHDRLCDGSSRARNHLHAATAKALIPTAIPKATQLFQSASVSLYPSLARLQRLSSPCCLPLPLDVRFHPRDLHRRDPKHPPGRLALRRGPQGQSYDDDGQRAQQCRTAIFTESEATGEVVWET